MVYCDYIKADCHAHDRERILVMMNDTNHAITENSSIYKMNSTHMNWLEAYKVLDTAHRNFCIMN